MASDSRNAVCRFSLGDRAAGGGVPWAILARSTAAGLQTRRDGSSGGGVSVWETTWIHMDRQGRGGLVRGVYGWTVGERTPRGTWVSAQCHCDLRGHLSVETKLGLGGPESFYQGQQSEARASQQAASCVWVHSQTDLALECRTRRASHPSAAFNITLTLYKAP